MSDVLDRLATEELSESLIRAAKKEIEYLQEIVLDLVLQSCVDDQGRLNSMATSAYAEAMRYLGDAGKIKILKEAHRLVIAEYPLPEVEVEVSDE